MLSAEFYGTGTGKGQLILLIPLIFILPLFISNKVFAVFLAEPVSDIIAAVVTTSVFMVKFKKLLVEDNS